MTCLRPGLLIQMVNASSCHALESRLIDGKALNPEPMLSSFPECALDRTHCFDRRVDSAFMGLARFEIDPHSKRPAGRDVDWSNVDSK